MTKFINYDEKSDYEINLMFLKMIRKQQSEAPGSTIVGWAHSGDECSVGIKNGDSYYWYDFCNNYNDSMRFLQRAGVSLIPLQEDGRWMGLTMFEGKKVTRYSGYHTKMLRAGIQALLAKDGA